jgi:uncharacterized cupredoxin-like copper-binding protein
MRRCFSGSRPLAAVGAFLAIVILASACSGDDDANPATGSRQTNREPQAIVKVELTEFRVMADRTSVRRGPTEFRAENISQSDVHELAVLRVKADGSYENTGEIEDLDPGASGSIVLDLPAGDYLLACLIAPGEAGSTRDHFKEGMKLAFTVE